ncbi:AAA family ATPase [Chryseolinea sp. T2]|uniref:AAA family ATPase n=1 Tax=Chryseolinea sp. T2 TaxID=3129255 RepID=UPI003076BDF0
MNLLTLIVGMPSSGKSTSFRNLGPETVMYNTEKKILPFRNKGIKQVSADTVNDLLHKLGQFKGSKYPEITNIVIDSFSDYSDMLMAECKARYKGFDVYNAYNSKVYELFQVLKAIENKFIFLTGHPEILQDAEANTIFRMAIRGKEYEGKVEKFATCVFYSDPRRKPNGKGVEYWFLTNTDGRFPAKTPMGMFQDLHIDNDVARIIEVYRSFYAQEPKSSQHAA